MDEGVVERGVDMSDTEDELALRDLGSERDGFLSSSDLGLLGGLFGLHPFVRAHIQHKTPCVLPLCANQQHLGT